MYKTIAKDKTGCLALLIAGMLLKAPNVSNRVLCTFSTHNGNYQQVAKAYTMRPSGIRLHTTQTETHSKIYYYSLISFMTFHPKVTR